jgi:uncharacterized protein (UPF0276 family)
LPIVIHAEHHSHGVNPTDSSIKNNNLKSLNFARNIADLAKAEKIVFHLGGIEKNNPYSSIENAINLVREVNDERILIENLPQLDEMSNYIRLCKTPKEIKKLMKETKSGFCFDINHALRNIKNFDGDYNFIKEYIKLNPKHYHIGGQNLNTMEDHLSFEKSNLNLRKIFSHYPKDAEITLETEADMYKIEKDLEIVRGAIESLGELAN